MKLWIWWINPRNWLAENFKQETRRRVSAVESNIQETQLRLNAQETQINRLLAEFPIHRD